MLSVREMTNGQGGRPDSNRYREDHNLGCSPLHHGHQAQQSLEETVGSPSPTLASDEELRRQASNLLLASNSRASYLFDYTGENREWSRQESNLHRAE